MMSKKSLSTVLFLAAVFCFVVPALRAEGVTQQQLAEYRARAEKGDAEAQFKLGVCHYYGEWMPKDMAKAVYWWQKSAEQGFAPAKEALKELGK